MSPLFDDPPSGYKIAFVKVKDFDGQELHGYDTRLPAKIQNPMIEIGLIPATTEISVTKWEVDEKIATMPPGAKILRLRAGDSFPIIFLKKQPIDAYSNGEYMGFPASHQLLEEGDDE